MLQSDLYIAINASTENAEIVLRMVRGCTVCANFSNENYVTCTSCTAGKFDIGYLAGIKSYCVSACPTGYTITEAPNCVKHAAADIIPLNFVNGFDTFALPD